MTFRPLIVLALISSACASQLPYESAPKTASGRAESMLLELVIRDAWNGESRILVTYEAMAPEGKVVASGARSWRRRLNAFDIQRLIVLVEQRLMLATSTPIACEDCKEYLLTTRLGDRAHFVVFGEIEGAPPSLVTDLLDAVHVRPAA